MSSFIRPFGLLGPRYEVGDKGLRYQRLAWLTAFLGVAAGALIISGLVDAGRGVGLAIMAGAMFPVLRFIALAIKHGHRVDERRA
ncbi:hypothetical protein ACWCOP_14080 [Maricaulaceae bacterium MS644]